MADYFISPKDKTDLHLELAEFADAIVRRWPAKLTTWSKTAKALTDSGGPYLCAIAGSTVR